VSAQQIQFEAGGASQSVGITPAGKLQIETTLFSYADLNKNRGSFFETGETLVRYGLVNDRLEARLKIFGLSFNDGNAGIDSLGLGTKIGLSKAEGLIPTADLIIDFSIPLSNDINTDNFIHSYKLTTDSPINSKCSISSNLALVFASTDSSTGDFTRTVIPYVIGINTKITDKLAFNSDLFGTWSLSGSKGNSLGVAPYLTYYFKDNFVGVVSGAFGLNDSTDLFSLFTGLVYRF
jgi:hypothetical protein